MRACTVTPTTRGASTLKSPTRRSRTSLEGERHGEADEQEGTFASGPDEAPVIPADHGDFARGQRRVDPS